MPKLSYTASWHRKRRAMRISDVGAVFESTSQVANAFFRQIQCPSRLFLCFETEFGLAFT